MIIIFSGYQGSGKSTLARAYMRYRYIKHNENIYFAQSDVVRRKLFDVRTYSADEHAATFKELNRLIDWYTQLGYDSIVDCTNLKEHDRKPYYKTADKYGVKAVVVIVDTNQYVIESRIKNRQDDENMSEAGYDVYLKTKERTPSISYPIDHDFIVVNGADEVAHNIGIIDSFIEKVKNL